MNPLRYILFPWWLAELATGAKAFSDNPLIGSPTLNRWGLHVGRVRLAAAALSASMPTRASICSTKPVRARWSIRGMEDPFFLCRSAGRPQPARGWLST